MFAPPCLLLDPGCKAHVGCPLWSRPSPLGLAHECARGPLFVLKRVNKAGPGWRRPSHFLRDAVQPPPCRFFLRRSLVSGFLLNKGWCTGGGCQVPGGRRGRVAAARILRNLIEQKGKWGSEVQLVVNMVFQSGHLLHGPFDGLPDLGQVFTHAVNSLVYSQSFAICLAPAGPVT